jgi:GNAT superfamily N-acetyltransferase
VAEWLEPDWVFDTNTMEYEYARGRLQRPRIEIAIRKEKGMWPYFRKYHYLNHDINAASEQFVGYYGDEPVCFHAVLHMPHPKVANIKRATRLVVIPDYQGIGIGSIMQERIAAYYVANGFRYVVTSAHPALNAHRSKMKCWRLNRQGRTSSGTASTRKSLQKCYSSRRVTTSWEYIGS